MFTPKYSRRFRTKHQEETRIPTQKLISFKLGNTVLAIPIERVQRIVEEFTPQGMLQTGRSLARNQNETITIVDVSMMFASSQDSRDRHYLIVCTFNGTGSENASTPHAGERFGIPIPEMPTILEVPKDKFSDVPELYRQGFADSASVMVLEAIEKLIDCADGTVAFYLNLDRLVSHLPVG